MNKSKQCLCVFLMLSIHCFFASHLEKQFHKFALDLFLVANCRNTANEAEFCTSDGLNLIIHAVSNLFQKKMHGLQHKSTKEKQNVYPGIMMF